MWNDETAIRMTPTAGYSRPPPGRFHKRHRLISNRIQLGRHDLMQKGEDEVTKGEGGVPRQENGKTEAEHENAIKIVRNMSFLEAILLLTESERDDYLWEVFSKKERELWGCFNAAMRTLHSAEEQLDHIYENILGAEYR